MIYPTDNMGQFIFYTPSDYIFITTRLGSPSSLTSYIIECICKKVSSFIYCKNNSDCCDGFKGIIRDKVSYHVRGIWLDNKSDNSGIVYIQKFINTTPITTGTYKDISSHIAHFENELEEGITIEDDSGKYPNQVILSFEIIEYKESFTSDHFRFDKEFFSSPVKEALGWN